MEEVERERKRHQKEFRSFGKSSVPCMARLWLCACMSYKSDLNSLKEINLFPGPCSVPFDASKNNIIYRHIFTCTSHCIFYYYYYYYYYMTIIIIYSVCVLYLSLCVYAFWCILQENALFTWLFAQHAIKISI